MNSKVDLLSATYLLTGGTGSFGRAFISRVLSNPKFKGIIRVYSRDEFKQYELQQFYPSEQRLRFFIGDVRDLSRLERAMEGVQVVIHAAALKHVTVAEYNPFEVIKTNILGSQNIVETALNTGVSKAILISSDKAVHPINLYGATKLVAERIFIQGNVYSGKQKTFFAVTRYGNVLGSRGSVVPLFLKQRDNGTLTLTHQEMTRFWISLPEAAKFVWDSLSTMKGGEIFVPKLPSVKIIDLAKVLAPKAKIAYNGIRPGEKYHEELLTEEEWERTEVRRNSYVVFPHIAFLTERGRALPQASRQKDIKPFLYCSNTNTNWLSPAMIQEELQKYFRTL